MLANWLYRLMDKLWISYPQGQESVDRRWIKCLFQWITYGSFQKGISNVDNLSTDHVHKFESYPPVHTNVDNLSTTNVDKFESHLLLRDNVDNFSTSLVDMFENTDQTEGIRGLLHKIT